MAACRSVSLIVGDGVFRLATKHTILVVTVLGLAASCTAQPIGLSFSVDVQGPTAGAFGTNPDQILDSLNGSRIGGGDILFPFEGTPAIAVFGGLPPAPVQLDGNDLPRGLGLATIRLNSDDEIELDALSYGKDFGNGFAFSVDEFAFARSGAVEYELSVDKAAAADIFLYRGPAQPTRPIRFPLEPSNSSLFDGDTSLNLIEPNPKILGVPDLGDNLDALNLDTDMADFRLGNPIYFSLDASFADPFEGGPPPNLGSADAQPVPVSAADVLVNVLGEIQVYIEASQLGLDPLVDDLDALALDEDGDMFFDPLVDQIFFSVRRGSGIIGTPDSRLQLPINPGDILTASENPGDKPAIFVAAEAMGLATDRSGVGAIAINAADPPDDLDALDIAEWLGEGDMNCNRVADSPDVSSFVVAVIDPVEYEIGGECDGDFVLPEVHGDTNRDGDFDFGDIERFVAWMEAWDVIDDSSGAPGSTLVPEPGVGGLLVAGGIYLGTAFRRRRCFAFTRATSS